MNEDILDKYNFNERNWLQIKRAHTRMFWQEFLSTRNRKTIGDGIDKRIIFYLKQLNKKQNIIPLWSCEGHHFLKQHEVFPLLSFLSLNENWKKTFKDNKCKILCKIGKEYLGIMYIDDTKYLGIWNYGKYKQYRIVLFLINEDNEHNYNIPNKYKMKFWKLLIDFL